MQNYFNYFTEIERFFQTKRRSFTLVSCVDWVLIESWMEQGIPLELVLKGIDRAFTNPKRRREIGSLAYCVKAIEKVCEEQKDLMVEDPKLPDFNPNEVVSYARKLAAQVERLDAGIAESIRSIDPSNLRVAEQILSALEEKLISKLKATADDKTMIELKREVDGELNPFRSTMTAAQLMMLEQQMWRRRVLERYEMPRLSLFYLI
ncbi:MAG: hypothetical protein DMG11_01970 [Acidobacteria bacterium]|nr:MAG: hypothetical protein DMG11_01970 [Acidobacteriota bacterium]